MKKVLVYAWLILLVTITVALFWYNDYQYKLPTPMPVRYKAVRGGALIKLPASLNSDKKKPVWLHFYNPDCPCSKFNLTYFKSLVKTYKDKVSFVIVVISNKPYRPLEIQHQLNLNVPVIRDASLALACGVYSTPQAVILTANRQLHYRGNYNSSRYCTNKRTAYARQALNNLLHNIPANNNPLATTAYGCRLANLTYEENATE